MTLFSPALSIGINFSLFFLFLIIHITENKSTIAITRNTITPVKAPIVVVIIMEFLVFEDSAKYIVITRQYYNDLNTAPSVTPSIIGEFLK